MYGHIHKYLCVKLTESSGLSKKENNKRRHEGGRGLLREIQRKLGGANMIICFIVYIYEILKIFLKIKKNGRHEGNASRTIFPFFHFIFAKIS